jgi:phosphonate degradation associated HDIG domain protein
MVLRIEDIVQLYKTRGAAAYGGEQVTQLEHALQCARLAEEADCPRELVISCMLHDIGHLLARRLGEAAAADDDVHQHMAVPILRDLFSPRVIDPIRLHVDAKRYLCYSEPGYFDALSAASKRSLALQGGPFETEDAHRFLRHAHAEDAVLLRRFDDLAKDPERAAPSLSHYAALMRACAMQPA